LNGLVDLGLVLLICLPCDSRCLSRRKLREKLVFSEEAREVEQIIGVARCSCEVTRRCWHNADALKKEVAWLESATARRTIARTTARRATSGEARRGAAGELILVLGELYRTGSSDGLSS
jgi:hypothetical protein